MNKISHGVINEIITEYVIHTYFKDDKFYQCVVDSYNSSYSPDIGYTTSLSDEQLNKMVLALEKNQFVEKVERVMR